MYIITSYLSAQKRARLIEQFVAGMTARAAGEIIGVHRNTAACLFTRLKKIIAFEMEEVFHFPGEVEVDESYFGGVRKGKRGRAAAGKIQVLGFLKRGGRVYTVMLPNTSTATLLPIME